MEEECEDLYRAKLIWLDCSEDVASLAWSIRQCNIRYRAAISWCGNVAVTERRVRSRYVRCDRRLVADCGVPKSKNL